MKYSIWFMIGLGLFIFTGCGHSLVPNVSVKKYKNIKSCSDVEYEQKVWEQKQKLAYISKYTAKESFRDLVVDAEGNSYILKPNTYGRLTKIVKYNYQWQKVWKIQMPRKEKLSIKALDINDKYIYIVGNGEIIAPPKNGSSTVTGYRYAAKYDLNGNQIWLTKERKKNSILNGNLILRDMAVSSDGSLYVVGFQMFNDSGYIDKYNTNGEILWHKSFKEMKFYGIAIDKKKNLCIVGETSDAAIITKYNSDGSPLWMKRIPTKNSENINLFINIDTDAYNNIYAVGHGYSQVAYIFKLSAEGKSLWKRKTLISAGGYDVGASIFCGVEKKIYLAGQALKPKKYNGYRKNLTIAMYDLNGKLLDNSLNIKKKNTDKLIRKFSFYKVYQRENGRFYILQNGKVLYDNLKYVALKKKLSNGNLVVLIDNNNHIQKVLIKSDELQTDLYIGVPLIPMCGVGVRQFKAKTVLKKEKIEIQLQDISEDNKPYQKQKKVLVASISKSEVDRLFFQNNKSEITYTSGNWFSDNIKLNSDYLFFQKGNKYGFFGEISDKIKNNKVYYVLKRSKNKNIYDKISVVDGYLLLVKNGLYGYYKKTKIKYKSLGKFEDGLVRFEHPNGKKGYLDLKGNEYYD